VEMSPWRINLIASNKFFKYYQDKV
jgi:hypothetical protein